MSSIAPPWRAVREVSAPWHWGESPSRLRSHLDRGGVLVIPTESSYALAVDPRHSQGVAAVYRIKGREAGKALPVVVADRDQLALLGIDLQLPLVARLAPAWPAALSLVLPLSRPLPAAGGEATVAVRVPAHARLRELLAVLGPLTATSANRSGEPPIVDPRRLPALLAEVAERRAMPPIVIDDGVLPGGLPSTLVAPAGDGVRVLRPGRFSAADLAALLGEGGGNGRER